ncbi:hypothetical protein U9M48_001746 [Paspalum notatum var. saurae]|uniref:Uncharacterized protein n=1 Tax=Paspalum notatum var. saurae TaxID=547442 RepID=A0AAQ3PF81_PASNO
MEITVHSSKIVKPDYRDGSNGDAVFASADVLPLSVFDKVNYDEFVFYIYAFHPPAPPTAVLEAALAKTLAEYREWAGRLGVVDASGNPVAIMLNDAGARFIDATADAEVAGSVTLLPTGANVMSVCPSCDGADELLLVQATRFQCGSLVLGFTMHHKVADGPGMWNFMVVWGQVTRGVAIVHHADAAPAGAGGVHGQRHALGVAGDHRAGGPKSFEGDGSVDAYMPLLSRTMDAFKKCCYSLPPIMANARL